MKGWQPPDLEGLPTLIPLERTFEGFLGLEWLELTATSASVRFEVRENLKQSLGLLHGGVYSAVAETMASVATFRVVWEDGFICSGSRNAANFLRPITGGQARAVGELRFRDEREWFWGHHFYDAKDRLCAVVDVTISVRRPRPIDASAS